MNVMATPGVRASLLRYAQRRLPREDAEDVVQQALCDALGIAAPETPGEQTRLLMTIVKRRVVDWYRARRPSTPIADDDVTTAPENAWLARDLLRRIEEEASPTDRRALDWLVREHEGESLTAIAEEERFTPVALRQRIHRLRASLRAHHLAIAVALLLGLGFFAKTRHEAIGIDPESTFVVGDARGIYRIEALSVTEATPAERVLLESYRGGLVRVEGDRIVALGAQSTTLGVVARPSDESLVVRTPQGREYQVSIQRGSTGDLILTTKGASFRGELRLRRE